MIMVALVVYLDDFAFFLQDSSSNKDIKGIVHASFNILFLLNLVHTINYVICWVTLIQQESRNKFACHFFIRCFFKLKNNVTDWCREMTETSCPILTNPTIVLFISWIFHVLCLTLLRWLGFWGNCLFCLTNLHLHWLSSLVFCIVCWWTWNFSNLHDKPPLPVEA